MRWRRCLLAGVPTLAPPVALWVRGPRQAAELSERAVAVVGARAATSYGTHVAGELGAGLAAAGATVVSGAAIGIDGAAHRGALAVRRRHGRRPRLRRRPRLPGRARHPARADRRHRARGERVPAGQRAGAAPLPGAQPADRGTRRGNGRRRGGAAERGAAHRDRHRGAGPGRHGRARPGHLGPVGGLPSADPRRGAAGHERGRRAGGRRPPRRRPGAGAGSAPARRTDGLGRAAALVHDALPARGARDTRWLARESGLPPDGDPRRLDRARTARPGAVLRRDVAAGPAGRRGCAAPWTSYDDARAPARGPGSS